MAAFTSTLFGLTQRLTIRSIKSVIRPASECMSTSSKHPEIPPPPKRPLPVFFKYCMTQRPKLLKEFQDLPIADIVKKIAASWSTLDQVEKEKYKAERRKEMEEFSKQYSNYLQELTPSQQETFKKNVRNKREIKMKKKTKKLLSELHKPQARKVSYIYFTTAKLKEKGNMSAIECIANAADEWKKMSEAEKMPYKKLAEEDKVRYYTEMKAWENKMVSEGRPELVRGSLQKKMKSKSSKTISSKIAKTKARVKKSESSKTKQKKISSDDI